jgi:hypothetical protein
MEPSKTIVTFGIFFWVELTVSYWLRKWRAAYGLNELKMCTACGTSHEFFLRGSQLTSIFSQVSQVLTTHLEFEAVFRPYSAVISGRNTAQNRPDVGPILFQKYGGTRFFLSGAGGQSFLFSNGFPSFVYSNPPKCQK